MQTEKTTAMSIVKREHANKVCMMLTYTHARRPEESFIFVRTHRHYHFFYSFAWLVGCSVLKKRVKIRKGANCYLYYSVKSSKPRGSTRYRRIPREPKQRKCNTHCVWGTRRFLWISRRTGRTRWFKRVQWWNVRDLATNRLCILGKSNRPQ